MCGLERAEERRGAGLGTAGEVDVGWVVGSECFEGFGSQAGCSWGC